MATQRRTHYQVTFAVLTVGVMAYALLQSLVSPVLPLFQKDLHTSQSAVTWVLTAYLLSASVFTPILGRIGDMVGKEKVLVGVFIALGVGSIVAAVASSITVLIIARVVQGIGGGVVPLSFGIIRDEFPREKIAGAVGVLAALIAVGGGLGLVLAGPIVDLLNYHWLFWIPGIVVIVAAVATQLVIPESPVRTPGHLSMAPALLLSGWLVALLVAVSEAPDWGWLSARVLGLLALAVVLGVVWVRVENRSAAPLIDMRMMRIPAVWTTNLVALLFGMGLYSSFAFLPEFVQTNHAQAGYGFSASITESGLIVLPMCVLMFIFGTLSGPIGNRFGAKWVLFMGSLITIVPFVLLGVAHSQIWEVVLATGLMGAGFGFAYSAMSSIVVDAVPAHQTGVASGMNANIRTIGGSIGASLMASIVVAGKLGNGLPKESGYSAGFLMLAGATVLAALACLLIPRISVMRTPEQSEQVAMRHPEAALVAGATIVGDLSE